MKLRHKQRCYLLGMLLGLPWVAKAQVMDTATLRVIVTVQAPPSCKLNNDKPIDVDFNEVLTTRVNGENYRQRVNFTLTCSAGAPNAMKFRVKGNSAWFDAKALQTNIMALGIAFWQGDKRVAINDWLTFNYPNLPVLYAVPVKAPGAVLDTGGFSVAGATLEVTFQ
ncbi:fimbrial protein [Serratia fonticola]|uniref:fimbrial protein n=1 Tax=Serratia fonticola TaxID=47917 RepID=UPI0015C5DEA3|nr:fimbrial protein [Serratia fonticola]MBC3378121.1 fimbrial protein [Serratia fonticola]NYA37321.1 fimbrial protein [Serratia fonticola]